MLKVGDIYYLCDQYGPKFVKIIQIGDLWNKDDNWVFFYKSAYLKNIVNASFPEDDRGCDGRSGDPNKAQVKKWHFEKLIEKITYVGNFKGCIKISDEIIESIKNGESDIINLITTDPSIYPYMCVISEDRVSCKRISKQDFRNLKLNKILE